MGIITLTTDFGERDGYVGIMKGVMLGITPALTFVDISHDIPPQDTAAAAFVLLNSYAYFPAESIHLVVVDPGVGSMRRPIAVRTEHGTFVAPDNGVLGYILEREKGWRAVHLTAREYWRPAVSQTFHGRDIFAPVAAHLAAGVPLEKLGVPISDPIPRSLPAVVPEGAARYRGEVLYVDRFGNVITNLAGASTVGGRPAAALGDALTATVEGRSIRGLHPAYSDVPKGSPLLIVGSSGFIEIALREGSAARFFGAQIGTPVFFDIVG